MIKVSSEIDVILGDRPAGPSATVGELPWESVSYNWRSQADGAFAKAVVDSAFLDAALGISDLSMAKAVPVPRSAEPPPSLAELRLRELFGETPFVPSRVPVEDEPPMDLLKRKAALKPACDCECAECAKGNCKGCEADEKCKFCEASQNKVAKLLGGFRRKLIDLYGTKVVNAPAVEDGLQRLHRSVDDYCDRACAEFAAGSL